MMSPADLSQPIYYPVYCNDGKCVWGWKSKDPLLVDMVGLCTRKTAMNRLQAPDVGWHCLYYHPKEVLGR